MSDRENEIEECRFGWPYGRGDGSKFCHTHADIVGPWHENQLHCPTVTEELVARQKRRTEEVGRGE